MVAPWDIPTETWSWSGQEVLGPPGGFPHPPRDLGRERRSPNRSKDAMAGEGPASPRPGRQAEWIHPQSELEECVGGAASASPRPHAALCPRQRKQTGQPDRLLREALWPRATGGEGLPVAAFACTAEGFTTKRGPT